MTRVLLVEDDRTVRNVIEMMLATEPDLELVAAVDSAEAAISATAELHPDLVLLDNQLVGSRTGLHAAPDIRAAHPSVLLLLCTALDTGDEQALQAAGVDGYLRKDNLMDLIEHIRALLDQPGSA